MMKCVVQGCTDTCYSQCFKRISPQRAEAIKSLGIVHKDVSNVCAVCKRSFIMARRGGKEIRICSCRVD